MIEQGKQRLMTVLGTRPEIIKCSPLIPRFDEAFEHVLVHTGQHYDDAMDARFFRDLALREPDVNLRVGSAGHATQLARMLGGLEPILGEWRPDWVFVQGDTNSTLAGALAASSVNVPVIHLEAGCRSFNRTMPEEVNRVLVDHIASLCLAPDKIAVENLLAEGIPQERVLMVGSTAIDACLRAASLQPEDDLPRRLGLVPGEYLVATIHRAENTRPERLAGLVGALHDLSARWPVLFPVHPRTASVLDAIGRPPGVIYREPLGYFEMIGALRACRALLTDSGGLQEEAAVLGIPTFVLRDETEWMAFVEAGHHRLVGTDRTTIVEAVLRTLNGGADEALMRMPIGRERAGASDRVLRALHLFDDTTVEGTRRWKPPTNRYAGAVALGWAMPFASFNSRGGER